MAKAEMRYFHNTAMLYMQHMSELLLSNHQGGSTSCASANWPVLLDIKWHNFLVATGVTVPVTCQSGSR